MNRTQMNRFMSQFGDNEGIFEERATDRPPVTSFQRLDLVQLGNGSRIIITGTNPNRPANKYRGVLEGGKGKEYIFGDKHRPVKVGTVTEGHPALLNSVTRKIDQSVSRLPDEVMAQIRTLIVAVKGSQDPVVVAAAVGLVGAGF